MPIGVFDSGLGGLTVLAAFRAALPGQDFLYLGDNAHAPYGVRPAAEIRALTEAGVAALFARGCELVVLACNTAAAVALRGMQEGWLPKVAPDHRVLGVLVPVIEVLSGRPWGSQAPPGPAPVARVALFATPATVASGAFARELALRATGVTVWSQSCPGLVDAIEAGDAGAAAEAVAGAVAALTALCPDPQQAVLGCTHYPLVEREFAAHLPPGVQILSQPQIAAASLADYLVRHPRFAGGTGRVAFLTTGDPARVTARAGGWPGVGAGFAAL